MKSGIIDTEYSLLMDYRCTLGKKKWHHDALLLSLEASPKCMSFRHPVHPAQTSVLFVLPRCLPSISRVS